MHELHPWHILEARLSERQPTMGPLKILPYQYIHFAWIDGRQLQVGEMIPPKIFFGQLILLSNPLIDETTIPSSTRNLFFPSIEQLSNSMSCVWMSVESKHDPKCSESCVPVSPICFTKSARIRVISLPASIIPKVRDAFFWTMTQIGTMATKTGFFSI